MRCSANAPGSQRARADQSDQRSGERRRRGSAGERIGFCLHVRSRTDHHIFELAQPTTEKIVHVLTRHGGTAKQASTR
jgi:hypothetical protein